MEHLEAAGVFVEIVDGACLPHHGPVYVQFDEQVFRVGVFDHVVQHDSLVLDLLEFVGVVVVAVFDSGLPRHFFPIALR